METPSNNFINPKQALVLIINFMNSSVKAYSKLKWTPQEQQFLRDIKQQKLVSSWKTIAQEMNQVFLQKNRSGKQCRERYMNYVRFGKQAPKMFGWTQQQDEELFCKFMEYGAKWVQIGKQMLGRSQNCLKNRFYGAMRKIIRKINRTTKQKKLRQKKPIKADLLIRILQHQFPNKQDEISQQAQFLDSLKKQMIKIAINPEESGTSQQIQSLITGILKFCTILKSLNIRKNSIKKQQQEIQSEQIIQSKQLGSGDQNLRQTAGVQQKQTQKLQNLGQKKQNEPVIKIRQNIILFSSNLPQSKTNYLSGFTLFQKNYSLNLKQQLTK